MESTSSTSSAMRWAALPFYEVAPDGQRFLVNMDLPRTEPIRLVVEWAAPAHREKPAQ